jgi:hypothetical protein
MAGKQTVSREIADRSSLRLVPGSGEQLATYSVTRKRWGRRSRVWERLRAREPGALRLLDAGFFMLALAVAAAMWWSVTVN